MSIAVRRTVRMPDVSMRYKLSNLLAQDPLYTVTLIFSCLRMYACKILILLSSSCKILLSSSMLLSIACQFNSLSISAPLVLNGSFCFPNGDKYSKLTMITAFNDNLWNDCATSTQQSCPTVLVTAPAVQTCCWHSAQLQCKVWFGMLSALLSRGDRQICLPRV